MSIGSYRLEKRASNYHRNPDTGDRRRPSPKRVRRRLAVTAATWISFHLNLSTHRTGQGSMSRSPRERQTTKPEYWRRQRPSVMSPTASGNCFRAWIWLSLRRATRRTVMSRFISPRVRRTTKPEYWRRRRPSSTSRMVFGNCCPPRTWHSSRRTIHRIGQCRVFILLRVRPTFCDLAL